MTLSLYLHHAPEAHLATIARHPDALASSAGRARSLPGRGRGRAPVTSELLSLGRSWQVLHGLFTGTAWDGPSPANTLMSGGRPTGPDIGGGAPRLVNAGETQAFARYLEPLCPYQLRGRVDRRRVSRTRFYAAETGECPDLEELRDSVVRDLPALKGYLRQATNEGHGLLLWMM